MCVDSAVVAWCGGVDVDVETKQKEKKNSARGSTAPWRDMNANVYENLERALS